MWLARNENNELHLFQNKQQKTSVNLATEKNN